MAAVYDVAAVDVIGELQVIVLKLRVQIHVAAANEWLLEIQAGVLRNTVRIEVG